MKKRFILLTFGFLGWAFYEMSGGADFAPKRPEIAATTTQQTTPTDIVVAQESPPQDPIQIERITQTQPVDTTPPGFENTDEAERVSRGSLNLAAVEDTTVKDASDAASDASASEITYVPINPGRTTSTEDAPAIIPSLIAPNDQGTVQAANTSDIRSVSGNRVNVRGGPGTEYGIVTKLGRGDTVEILQDNGDGWVKMRPIDGGPEGWMADFLLTSG